MSLLGARFFRQASVAPTAKPPASTRAEADNRALRYRAVRDCVMLATGLMALAVSYTLPAMSPEQLLGTLSIGLALIVLLLVALRWGASTVAVINVVLGMAVLATLVNAWYGERPFLDIQYLPIIPLIALLLLDARTATVWAVVVLATYGVFGFFVIYPTEPDAFFRLGIQSVYFNSFFILMAYHRERAERRRRETALAGARMDTLQLLVDSVSHDIKTPLTTINTSAYMLRAGLPEDRRLHRIEVIEQQVARMSAMIDDLTELTRLDGPGYRTLQINDMRKIVRRTLTHHAPQAELHGVTLNADMPPDDRGSALVYANTEDLMRVAGNLTQNALSYTPEGGSVRLTLCVEATTVRLTVTDTGMGISATELPHIFEPFYRAAAAQKTYTNGSGLGLSLVQRTLGLYGGTIAVDSTHGKGTTFTVTLPREVRPLR